MVLTTISFSDIQQSKSYITNKNVALLFTKKQTDAHYKVLCKTKQCVCDILALENKIKKPAVNRTGTSFTEVLQWHYSTLL